VREGKQEGIKGRRKLFARKKVFFLARPWSTHVTHANRWMNARGNVPPEEKECWNTRSLWEKGGKKCISGRGMEVSTTTKLPRK